MNRRRRFDDFSNNNVSLDPELSLRQRFLWLSEPVLLEHLFGSGGVNQSHDEREILEKDWEEFCETLLTASTFGDALKIQRTNRDPEEEHLKEEEPAFVQRLSKYFSKGSTPPLFAGHSIFNGCATDDAQSAAKKLEIVELCLSGVHQKILKLKAAEEEEKARLRIAEQLKHLGRRQGGAGHHNGGSQQGAAVFTYTIGSMDASNHFIASGMLKLSE